MSFPEEQPAEGNGEEVTLNAEEAGTVVQALVDAQAELEQAPEADEQVKQEIAAAVEILAEDVQIEEAPPA